MGEFHMGEFLPHDPLKTVVHGPLKADFMTP